MGLDDEGPYTCRAANEGGFKEEKAYVRVQGQYSKTCVKRPLSKRPQIGFQDQLSLNAGQKYFGMLIVPKTYGPIQ